MDNYFQRFCALDPSLAPALMATLDEWTGEAKIPAGMLWAAVGRNLAHHWTSYDPDHLTEWIALIESAATDERAEVRSRATSYLLESLENHVLHDDPEFWPQIRSTLGPAAQEAIALSDARMGMDISWWTHPSPANCQDDEIASPSPRERVLQILERVAQTYPDADEAQTARASIEQINTASDDANLDAALERLSCSAAAGWPHAWREASVLLDLIAEATLDATASVEAVVTFFDSNGPASITTPDGGPGRPGDHWFGPAAVVDENPLVVQDDDGQQIIIHGPFKAAVTRTSREPNRHLDISGFTRLDVTLNGSSERFTRSYTQGTLTILVSNPTTEDVRGGSRSSRWRLRRRKG